MDQINQDMRDAEKNLEGLEKCCGLCVLPWKRSVCTLTSLTDFSQAYKVILESLQWEDGLEENKLAFVFVHEIKLYIDK